MSGLASGGEFEVAVDARRAEAVAGGLQIGEVVHGRIVEMRSDNTAVVDVLGERIEVVLPEAQKIGTVLSLRILDMREGNVDAQLVSQSAHTANPYLKSSGSTGTDMVRSVRRLVDAAANRIFGMSEAPAPAARARAVLADSLLRVAIRGDRPLSKLLSFEPETLALSTALAGATSEDLLAAQAALERLDVPLTPLTIAAALPEANDPARFVGVLKRMNAMLAETALEGRTQTLVTLAQFFAHICPEEDALDAQISGFVDQIATGGERKLRDLLAALAQRGQSTATARMFLTARATERATSLTNDIKTQLLAVSNGQKSDPALAAMLTSALEVVTAAQITSLNAAHTNPGAVGFVLPIVLAAGGTRAAQILVQRESPEGRNRQSDAANFRLSFVLETRRLGTVRIDVECVARALRVTVEAQTTTAAEELRAGLEKLRGVLETRGYRIVAMTAQVVRRIEYREDGENEEQRTYMPSLRAGQHAGDSGTAVHLDTRA